LKNGFPTLGWAIVALVVWVQGLAGQDGTRFNVFILAGQSNMEGKAANELLNHQAVNPQTADLFRHLRLNDQWIVRDDVFIKFLDRHGRLTVGFGSPNKTGLELEFGTATGDHFDEPVLLVKTAWGGHSLYKNFRPPSAGLPSDERLQQELAHAQKQVASNNEKNNRDDPLPTLEQIQEGYGSSYRNMLEEIQATLTKSDSLFPELKGARPVIAGFVWFQGFNDQFGEFAADEYAANMKLFIQDVRRDLGVDNLPFVIGAPGQNGSSPAKDAMRTIANAQLAMNEVPEFNGTVRAIRTDVLVDLEAERLYPNWRDHLDKWNQVGSDHPYHYLGSAIWFNRIGRAMADAMLDLLPQPSTSRDR
jgi:alpha-galactosidase